jgi:uncharacterized protein (TIGR02246 family)
MHPKSGALALAAALFALVAGPLAAQQDADAEAAEQQIRELDRKWVEAIRAGDVDTIADIYAEDGLVMPPNAVQAEGTEAVRRFWEGLLGLPNASLTFEPSRIEVAGAGDIAYDIGTYALGFDTDQGRVEDEGKYVVVWTKEEGEWKVAADIFNSNKPAP